MPASWTRDEVILGLDVLLFNDSKYLTVDSEVIIELSELLNRLPIIKISERNNTFRNAAGVSTQLSRFLWSLKYKEKHANINKLFFSVFNEYKDNPEKLHAIGQAIRRNESFFQQIGFGATEEADGFPEGAILCHLHRYLERKKNSQYLKDASHCSICYIKPEHIYGSLPNVQFFESHLLIPPTEISVDIKFAEEDFIIVCPNCHRILHQLRPWRNRKQCEDILQTL